MSHDLDLREQGRKLLSGSLPLDEFRHWFANAIWDIEGSADDDTVALAYRIENRIAEFTGGHIDEARLLSALRSDLVGWFGPDALVVACPVVQQLLRSVVLSGAAEDRWPRIESTARVVERRVPAAAGRPATIRTEANARPRVIDWFQVRPAAGELLGAGRG